METLINYTQLDRRRGHRFLPPKAARAKIPALYATEDTSAGDTMIHLHYFVGGCDWYIAEADWDTGLAFGWAELAAGCGEWGYVSLAELATLTVGPFVVERDCYFDPTPARDIARINGGR